MAGTPVSNAAIGRRVRVYWPDEDEWFVGCVDAFDVDQGVFVRYDDGDERWEALAQRVVFDDENEHQQQQPPQQHENDNNEDNGSGDDGYDGELANAMSLTEQPFRPVNRAPQMMEPPASPSDAYDDEYNDDDESEEDRDDIRAAHTKYHNANIDGDDDIERIDLATADVTESKSVIDGGGSDNDAEESSRRHLLSDGDDECEQSIAMSEVPITFERIRSTRNAAQQPLSARSRNDDSIQRHARAVQPLPLRGVLRGRVLQASSLPSTATLRASDNRRDVRPPRAFVKVAFAEASDSSSVGASSLMLRCKHVLAKTSVAAPSHDPVWNADPLTEDNDDSNNNNEHVDGGFQMQLAPPVALAETPERSNASPAWLQLRGDILFSVYSASSDNDLGSDDYNDHARHYTVHDFIGQAVLSLRDVLEHVLFQAPMLVQHLPLQTRQGKPLQQHGTQRGRRAFGYDGGDDSDDDNYSDVLMRPEIVVALAFEATYSDDMRRRTAPSSVAAKQPRQARSSMQSMHKQEQQRSTTSLISQPKTSARELQPEHAKSAANKAPTARRSAKKTPAQTSSSAINRRRLAKQIDDENVALSKRIEGQHARRVVRADLTKAQAKSKQPVPQHGSMKRDHKASSSVNRNKFHDQVVVANRVMEKRLHAIALKNNHRDSSRWASAKSEAKTPRGGILNVGFDDPDKDKALALDRRQQRFREQDYLAARAQAKYQQQSSLVDDVMELQTDIAALRTQVFTTKTSVNRLEILNNKDEHLRKCLRSAAASAATSNSTHDGVATSVKRIAASRRAAAGGGERGEDAHGAESSPSVTRHRKELELLEIEATNLATEKQRVSQELQTCDEQTRTADDELQRLGAQLRFVQVKQAFRTRMRSSGAGSAGSSSGAAAELQRAQEMKLKQQRLELSRDDEEQWTLYQAQQELTQLQIAVQVLKQQQAPATTVASDSSDKTTPPQSAACAYLQKKIDKQRPKLEQLERERSDLEREYEALVASGEYETLHQQVQELQQTLFLCQQQSKHVAAAERHAKVAAAALQSTLQREAFAQQTETDVLFKQRKR